ncbi:MAG TPA: SDR family oxidoreductase [Candidatus Hydrogenedentes bacterium]|nr:SDR family oxidoreductase [Candidatus Hydrogenedentota bacterium]
MPFAPFDLTGKVALITGGNSGIGLGFGEGLAQAGADICIWGTNETKNADATENLLQYGTKVISMKCDVGDKEQVTESFAKAIEAFGHVDSCFANAGIGGKGTPFAKMTPEEWHAVFRVNMDGVFYTFQECINHMVEAGNGGSLVVTSSTSSKFGAPRSEHYAATKSGVNSMIQGLAVEYARYGIRANSILPGWIESAMTERAFSNEIFEEKVLTRVPQRRWGTRHDFSGLAVYLASDASSYHTGDFFLIDGGYSAF